MGKTFIVNFPEIGEGVMEGEIIEWRKKEGDVLMQDEPVVVVMTDKATVELPSPYPGVLKKCYKEVGGIAIKDQPLYEIELEGNEDLRSTQTQKQDSAASAKLPKVAAKEISKKTLIPGTSKETKQVLATPKVRGLAKQLGISLTEIHGTRDNGRITAKDLPLQTKQAVSEPTAICQLSGDEEQPLIGIKALMAKKMTESKTKIPHFSYFEEADATRLIQLKDNSKQKASAEGIHITYTPFILRALSICIKKYPILNSSFDAEHSKIILHHRQNIGIAMSTPLGLIVPVLKEVENLGIEALIRNYEELIQRARRNKLLPSDMKEGTLTISNFGSIGNHGLWATPIINYPEAAILAIGRIHQQPIAKNGLVTVGDRINFSWSFDHRLIDGDMASQISRSFCSLIENPAMLL